MIITEKFLLKSGFKEVYDKDNYPNPCLSIDETDYKILIEKYHRIPDCDREWMCRAEKITNIFHNNCSDTDIETV